METDWVSIRILQMMSQHMGMEIRFLVESLVTVLKAAREWLLSSVDAEMSFQIEV